MPLSIHNRHKSGSSPLTRGAQHAEGQYKRERRLIPAYAGSTRRRARREPSRRAHPRLRGEHAQFEELAIETEGSSPLTRGALRMSAISSPFPRLIPAYAGSTQAWFQAHGSVWAHPRLRGEHKPQTTMPTSESGSSPLTRGARVGEDGECVPGGLIPAYAGSTHVKRCSRGARAAHPRLRGEHTRGGDGNEYERGSSPLTRGARWFLLSVLAAGGLIPAYAGSTGHACSAPSSTPAHPRLRGEHIFVV